MSESTSIHGASEADHSDLSFPIPPRLPPISGSPPPRAASGSSFRSASESEYTISSFQHNIAGVRKVSEPVPVEFTHTSPLKEPARITGDSGAEKGAGLDFSSPSSTVGVLAFDLQDPFRVPYTGKSFEEEEGEGSEEQGYSPLSRPVFPPSMVDYDSHDEDSPHTTLSNPSSRSSDSLGRVMDISPPEAGTAGPQRSHTAPTSVTEAHSIAPQPTIAAMVKAPKARPKSSLFARLLRQPVDDDFEPVATSVSGQQQQPTAKANKRKSNNPDKWSKRASRKAPPPPVSVEGPEDDDSLSSLGLQLSRQPGNGTDTPRRNIRSFLRRSEDDRGSLGDEDDEVSWERVRTLPRVCLFPPEEESSEPITLYPPPPPPQLTRPPLLHLASERANPAARSSRSSLYSNSSFGSKGPGSGLSMAVGSGGDMWGGMSGGFTKPPPVFKRHPKRGSAPPQGIVMPKSRGQVQKENEWRMSLINQEMDDFDMVWKREQQVDSPDMNVDPGEIEARPQRPPLTRMTSPPIVPPMAPIQQATTCLDERVAPTSLAGPTENSGSTTPRGIYEEPDADPSPDRSSAPPMVDFGASPPPLVLITQHTDDSQDDKEGTNSADIALVESPTTLPEALPEQPLEAPLPQRSQTTPATTPISDTNAAVPSGRRSSEGSGSTASSTPSGKPGRTLKNRRSMSLTSMFNSKTKDEVPPVPAPSQSSSTGPHKKIKKQRSLKKFFFSSDNLAREESGAVPPLPKTPVDFSSEKEQLRSRKDEEKERVRVIAAEMKSREKAFEKEKQRLKGAEKAEKAERAAENASLAGSRKSSRSALSRPKPNLKIDVKAAKAPHLPSPSIPPVPHSAPISSGSSGSEPSYPDTPSSRSSLGSRPINRSPPPVSMPESAGGAGRGLTKRFSLTNMSGAFRRSKKNLAATAAAPSPPVPPVPQVPALPDMYKKDKPKGKSWQPFQSQAKHSAPPTSSAHLAREQARARTQDDQEREVKISSVPMPSSGQMAKSTSLPHVQFDGDPGSFLSKEDQQAYLSPPASPQIPETELPPAPGSGRDTIRTNSPALSLDEAFSRVSSPSTSGTGRRGLGGSKLSLVNLKKRMSAAYSAGQKVSSAESVLSDTSSNFDLEQELDEAQLVLVSPRTRKDPAYNLQNVMGITPGSKTVVESPDEKRKSMEAILVGPLLVPPTPPATDSTITGLSLSESPVSESIHGHSKVSEGEVAAVAGAAEAGDIQCGLLESPLTSDMEDTPTQSPRGSADRTGTKGTGSKDEVSAGPRQSESESSLASLSHSVSSEPSELPCVTPASPNSESLHYPAPISNTAASRYTDESPTLARSGAAGSSQEQTRSPDSAMDIDQDVVTRTAQDGEDDVEDQTTSPEFVTAPNSRQSLASAPDPYVPLNELPSDESDLVVVHPSPSMDIEGAPAESSPSTVSPKSNKSSRWSPENNPILRFFSPSTAGGSGSEKESPVSTISKLSKLASPKTASRAIEPVRTSTDTATTSATQLELDGHSTLRGSDGLDGKKERYSVIKDELQLKSLHFDSLQFNFDGFGWSSDSEGAGKGLGLDALGLEGIEEDAIDRVV